MKKMFLLVTPIFLLASQTSLEEKIKSLENDIKTLKQEVKYHQEDLDERIPIIESVEKKSILDKINLSPEILVRFDKFDYKTGEIGDNPEYENTQVYDKAGNPTGSRRDNFEKNYDIASSIRFRLNMSMELEDIKFHGRLLYMNSSQSHQRVCILSRDIKTGTSGSAFDVDRAYVDYAFNKNSPYAFTFSFGILPTTGGTPMQFAQNSQRTSLFPALVFDMNTYGMIGTQKFGENTFARLVLAKPYTLRPNFYPYQCNRENIDNANIIGLYADTKFNFFGSALLSFGVNVLNDFKAHPYLGPDVDSSNSHDLGTIATFGLGIDIQKLAQTNTTLFIHTALSNPHPNGETDDYQISAYNPYDPSQTLEDSKTVEGEAGFTEADYASGEMLGDNGYSIYIGTKYDINDMFHLGAEYNYGSKYWFSATQGAEDMYNKLALRGNAYEIYGVWKMHKYLSAKLAYLNMQENYTGSGWHFGEPASKDATQNISYLQLEARF